MKNMINSTIKTTFFKLTSVITLSIALISCSDSKKIVDLNLKYVPAKTIPADKPNVEAQAQLAEAATAIGQSMQELSAMQLAIQPKSKMPQSINASLPGMGKLASADWTGPVEPFFRKLAEETQYQLRIIGKKPAIPVLVSLDIRNQPVGNILRDATYQIVNKASVVVYSNSRTIELRYHGN